MRIIGAKELKAMPPGTVYQEYEPCVSDDIYIKGASWHSDFLCQPVSGTLALQCSGSDQMHDRLDEMENCGASYPIDLDCMGRDGIFDDTRLFIVWERADVESLIARLQQALRDST